MIRRLLVIAGIVAGIASYLALNWWLARLCSNAANDPFVPWFLSFVFIFSVTGLGISFLVSWGLTALFYWVLTGKVFSLEDFWINCIDGLEDLMKRRGRYKKEPEMDKDEIQAWKELNEEFPGMEKEGGYGL